MTLNAQRLAERGKDVEFLSFALRRQIMQELDALEREAFSVMYKSGQKINKKEYIRKKLYARQILLDSAMIQEVVHWRYVT